LKKTANNGALSLQATDFVTGATAFKDNRHIQYITYSVLIFYWMYLIVTISMTCFTH